MNIEEKEKVQESLEEQLALCPHVRGKERAFFRDYLEKRGIADLSEIREEDILDFQMRVRNDAALSPSQRTHYVSIPEQVLLPYLAPKDPELIKRAKKLIGARAVRNRVCCFLLRRGIREITYPVRKEYESFLSHTVEKETVPLYLKALDILKLDEIRRKKLLPAAWQDIPYSERQVFLLYFPEEGRARSFYFVQDKEELLFDFSLPAPDLMKRQVYRFLLHVLMDHPFGTEGERHDRRERFLLPLRFLYLYACERGIPDLERMEKEDTDGFRQSLEGRAESKTGIYMQVVDSIRRYLFCTDETTCWEATVWYSGRFSLDEQRINEANPIDRFSFLDVRRPENREAFQSYMGYLLAISGRLSLQSIRCRYYSAKDLLCFLEESGKDVQEISGQDLRQWVKKLTESGCQADTVNRKISDAEAFLSYLSAKVPGTGILPIAGDLRQKVYPMHHYRSLPMELLQRLILASIGFPETDKLMFLVLAGTGLRKNEICLLRARDVKENREEGAYFLVYQKKLKNWKKMPVPPILVRLLKAYAKEKGRKPGEYLFQGKNGGPYRAQVFSRRVRSLIREADIDYDFRAHDLRHTVATMLYEAGTDMQTIRGYLGHRSTEMTKQYIDCIWMELEKKQREYFWEEEEENEDPHEGPALLGEGDGGDEAAPSGLPGEGI